MRQHDDARELPLGSLARRHLTGRSVRVQEHGWTRIADDLRTTAGMELALRFTPSDGPSWREAAVWLDGKLVVGFGHGFSTDPEHFLAELADYLREEVLDEEVGGGWPTCPDHRTHSLEAGTDEAGVAICYCPRGTTVARIGALAETG
jgi:hypothetical protein